MEIGDELLSQGRILSPLFWHGYCSELVWPGDLVDLRAYMKSLTQAAQPTLMQA